MQKVQPGEGVREFKFSDRRVPQRFLTPWPYFNSKNNPQFKGFARTKVCWPEFSITLVILSLWQSRVTLARRLASTGTDQKSQNEKRGEWGGHRLVLPILRYRDILESIHYGYAATMETKIAFVKAGKRILNEIATVQWPCGHLYPLCTRV